ncbi:MAG: hypothetical protein IJD20_00970 [Oscillospiraceae bacterium]|nr:hypothetical protein [Oscillospiraceae bacterium]
MEFDREKDQLNIDASSEETTYDVEDIIAEFGSGADTPVQDDADEVVRIWSPKPRESDPVPEPSDAQEPEQQPSADEPEGSDTPEETDEPEAADTEEDLPPVRTPRVKRRSVLQHLVRMRARILAAEEAASFLSTEEARSAYLQQRGRRRLPQLLSWLLTLLSAVVVMLPLQPWLDLSFLLTPALCGAFCFGALLCQLLLTQPVLLRGIRRVQTLRFSKESYLALTVLVVLLHALHCLITASSGCELCAVASLLLTVAQQGDDSLTSAKANCLSRAMSMDAPAAVVRCAKLWDGKDCLSRRTADREEPLQAIEEAPSSEKRLSAGTLLLAALTFSVALIAAVKGGRDFLWAWSILLLGSAPVGAFWAYGRSFRTLNKRLLSAGAVVLGWCGAHRLGGSTGIILRDEDLFPGKAVTLNGVKVFGAHSPERLLGYAAAMLDRAGAGAASAFSESLELRNARRFHTDHFRTYDAGGLGAEIQGDVVLLGSRGFLKTMGVEVPSEARVAQALYISLNGEAAGLFALRYSASDAARSGLGAILGSRGLRPILATRDALMTPDNIGRIYKLSADRLEFPVLRDRIGLSSPSAAEEGSPCALLARSSFLSFCAAVTNGRRFCRRFRQALLIAELGSVVGLITMVLLALMGAVGSASAVNLLLYHLAWLIPSLWVTSGFGS